VLDTAAIPFIIYIWYEGGQLRPSLVKPDRKVELALPAFRDEVGRCLEAKGADIG
jgi:hypothetical protein